AVAACAFVFKADANYSRVAFGLAWTAAIITIPFVRFSTHTLLQHLDWWGESAVIFGIFSEAIQVLRSLSHAHSPGYRVVAVIAPDSTATPPAIDGVPVFGGPDALDLFSALGVSTLLLREGFDQPYVLDALHKKFRHLVLVRDGVMMPVEHMRLRNFGGVV